MEKEKPLISFIIATYNLPATLLEECVSSILAVTLPAYEREIIVVDDGSAPPAIDVLKKYLEEIVYVRQTNGGLSSARNRGISLAQGEYIQFVDGDDHLWAGLYNQYIDKVRTDHPDILTFPLSDSEAEPTAEVVFQAPQEGHEYLLHNNLRASACGYLFRRSLLMDLRFSTLLHEDEEFTPLLFLRADRLISADASPYYYRRRQQSITHDDSREWIERRLTDMHTVILRLQHKAATLPTAYREALQRRVHQLTMDYMYIIITSTHDPSLLEKSIEQLRSEGLFPLPDKGYTTKYSWFRRLSSNSMGRRLLFQILKKR